MRHTFYGRLYIDSIAETLRQPMATYIVNTVLPTRMTNGIELGPADHLIVESTGSVSSSDSNGVHAVSGNLTATIMGSISAHINGINSLAGHNFIHVGSTGSINGGRTGISIGGAASHNVIRNEGHIIGRLDTGLYVTGASADLINSGTIGSYSGIALRCITSLGSFLLNSGSILGGYVDGAYVAFEGWDGIDQITNTGLIQGNVNLSGGNDIFDSRSGTIIIGIIDLGAGNNRAFGSVGNDRFRSSGGNDTIDGGEGNDQLIISNGAVDISVDLQRTDVQFTGVSNSLYLGIENVTTGNGHDTIIGNDAHNNIFGGEGNNTLEGGLGNDTLAGGRATDTAVFSGAAGATVNLSLQGTRQNTGYGWDILADIENLRGGAGNDSFKGDGEANLLEGAGGNDTLQGNAGNDTLDGGAGTNTAVFAGIRGDYLIENVGGVRTVTGQGARGGDGIDQIKNIRFLKFTDQVVALSNAAPTGPALSSATVAENAPVNSVAATLSATDADGDTIEYSLVPGSSSAFTIIGNSLIVTGAIDFETSRQHTVTVQAKDAYGGVATTTVNLSVINAVENTPFTLRGTSGADSLTGEAGNDTIYGGLGNDVLIGGAGKDVFVFDTRLNKRTNVDQVLDFNSRDDSFHLDNAIFTKLGSGSASRPKKFNSDMFVEGTRARDAEDRVVYDKKTGKLYYDEDGTGSKAQIHIATLANKTKLAYHDFFVI